jgi:hypothetical protein
MMRIQRAMFGRRLRLGAGWAAAAVLDGIALDLAKQGVPTIGDTATDDPKRAALANFCSCRPTRMDAPNPEFAQSRPGRFGRGATEGLECVDTAGKCEHPNLLSDESCSVLELTARVR